MSDHRGYALALLATFLLILGIVGPCALLERGPEPDDVLWRESQPFPSGGFATVNTDAESPEIPEPVDPYENDDHRSGCSLCEPGGHE